MPTLVVLQLVVALVHVAVYFAGVGLGWWTDGPYARDTVFLSALVVALVVVLVLLRRRSTARRAEAARRPPLTLLIPMPVFTALTAESSIELIRTAGGAGDRHPFLSAVILIASLAAMWSLGRQAVDTTGVRLTDRE